MGFAHPSIGNRKLHSSSSRGGSAFFFERSSVVVCPIACKNANQNATPPTRQAHIPKSRSGGRRSWGDCFDELQSFGTTHGHASVPRDSDLYRWSIHQRAAWRKGTLPIERYRQLSAIGFQWDLQFERWKSMFYRLTAFQQSHGHCNVPLRLQDATCDPQLARWVVKQRHLWKQGFLPDDRRRRLEGIDFSFSPDEDVFRARLGQLRAWRERHGHANVPRSCEECPGLARWTDSVRLRWRQGKLPLNFFRDLRDLGFSFAPSALSWDAQYQDLTSFATRSGHCNPAFIEHSRLHTWLAAQRRKYASGALSTRRAKMLDELGVDLRSHSVVFEERLRQLTAVYRATGSPSPPPSDRRLIQWVTQIRAHGRTGLSKANLKKLDAVEFQFPP